MSLVGLALLALCASPCDSLAGKLDPSDWIVYNFSGLLATNLTNGTPLPPSGLHVVSSSSTNSVVQTNGQNGTTIAANQLTDLTDNNPATFTTLTNPAIVLIDMQATNVVDRIYTIGSIAPSNMWPNYNANNSTPPLGLIVAYVGNTIANTNQVAAWTVPYDAGNPVETEADMRFSPASGRFVRLEFRTQVTWGTNFWPGSPINWPGYTVNPPAWTNANWNLGEVEVYGFTGTNALATNLNAIVVPTNAMMTAGAGVNNTTLAPLAVAAEDLSYYLGELTGLPHPIIEASQSNQYSGTIYVIKDLSSLAPNYSTMMANIASGALQTNVAVNKAGGQIVFSTWPYRAVLWSVWSFLETNGVRWVYPNAHGDYVPTGNGVNLSIVPYTNNPPTISILANFDLFQYQPWVASMNQSLRQEYLYWWRNHWTYFWSGYGVLGGSEIPAMAQSGSIGSLFIEGFAGYPGNFGTVAPDRILEMTNYTNWWGWTSTNPSSATESSGGQPTFAMDTPSAITWVARKMTNWNSVDPLPCTYPLNDCHINRPWQLLPDDACTYSQDPYSVASNGPTVLDPLPWVKMYANSYSGAYYSFVTAVANQVQQMSPSSVPLVGALAYADVFLPPTNIAALATFPTNVQVEVCLYGAPNLPMTAAANAGMKAAFDGWRGACSHLAAYDYALLHTDVYEPDPRLPVPLIAGILAHSQYLASIEALDGGCQGNVTSVPYNPWNFYAYPRTRWDPNQTAAQLEQEFFTGYFCEAGVPMLAYYQVLENYQVSNGVNLHAAGYCYNMTPGSYPPMILYQMQTNLTAALALATNWWVIDRITNIQAAFEWTITNSPDNLVGINLANTNQWETLSPSTTTPTTMNINSFYVPTNGLPWGNAAYWQGPFWNLPSFAQVQQTYNISAGAYTLTVNAHGAEYSGYWPIMDVYLGPKVVSGITVSNTTSTAYDFTFTVPAGTLDIAVVSEAGIPAAFLYLDGLTIIQQ